MIWLTSRLRRPNGLNASKLLRVKSPLARGLGPLDVGDSGARVALTLSDNLLGWCFDVAKGCRSRVPLMEDLFEDPPMELPSAPDGLGTPRAFVSPGVSAESSTRILRTLSASLPWLKNEKKYCGEEN